MNHIDLKNNRLSGKGTRGIYSLPVIFLIFFFYSITASPCRAQEIPLDKQLDGLGPKPRIAYLKYLIDKKGANADIHFHLGLAFHEETETDSAIYYYEMAAEEDTAMFKAFSNMGVLYDNIGNFPKAVENYKKAIKIRPGAVLPNSHIAYLYYRQNSYRTAIDYLRRALKGNPDHPQPHFYLAIFFFDSMIYKEAVNEWEKVIELAPDDPLARRAEDNIAMVRRTISEPSGLKKTSSDDTVSN